MIVEILLGLVIVFVTATYFKNKSRRDRNLPPGPLSLPIIGHLHLMGDPSKFSHMAVKNSKNYDGIFSLDMGTRTAVFLSTMPLIKEAFVTKKKLFSNRPIDLTPIKYGWYANGPTKGLIFANEKRHKAAGMVFGKCITKPAVLAKIYDIHKVEIARKIEALKSRSEEKSVVGADEVSLGVSFNAMTQLVFGERGYHVDSTVGGLYHTQTEAMKEFSRPFIQDYLPIMSFAETARVEKYKRNCAKRDALVAEICDNRPAEANFMMDELLKLTETTETVKARHLVHEILTAGFDTSAHTLQTLLLAIAKYPDVQEKLYQSLKDVDVDACNIKELRNNEYLTWVVQEAFRYRPTAPLYLMHEAAEDAELGGYFVPKGALIMGIHECVALEKERFGDPEVFRPERWATEKFDIAPFSLGPRACPGRKVAMAFLYRIIGMYVKAFEWSETEKTNAEESEFCAVVKYEVEPKFYVKSRA